MILIDKKKKDSIIMQYEQLLQSVKEKEGEEFLASETELDNIAAAKEELEKVFSQYQLSINELEYLISRYQKLHTAIRVQLRMVRIKIGQQSYK